VKVYEGANIRNVALVGLDFEGIHSGSGVRQVIDINPIVSRHPVLISLAKESGVSSGHNQRLHVIALDVDALVMIDDVAVTLRIRTIALGIEAEGDFIRRRHDDLATSGDLSGRRGWQYPLLGGISAHGRSDAVDAASDGVRSG